MKTYAPGYYRRFRCRAGDCLHSCCIGWEIDIDDRTLNRYATVDGEFGERLRGGIECCDGGACFKMGEGGRCAFLNSLGLCDVICELGDGYLADICREHPRFYNVYSGRREIGLGLTCEAAAELILGEELPFSLDCIEGDREELSEWESELIRMRDEVLSVLTDRTESIDERVARLDGEHGIGLYDRDIGEWCELFSELDSMDETFGELLDSAKGNGDGEILPCFFITFEQILCYFAFRHLSVAEDTDDFRARLGFCLIGYRMIRAMASARGISELSELCEICRIYSSEIEYSEENTEAIVGEFAIF